MVEVYIVLIDNRKLGEGWGILKICSTKEKAEKFVKDDFEYCKKISGNEKIKLEEWKIEEWILDDGLKRFKSGD